jgi:hypothetical protein
MLFGTRAKGKGGFLGCRRDLGVIPWDGAGRAVAGQECCGMGFEWVRKIEEI